ncbi:hypothetical protein [Coleofasciculus sp. G2-EDA-02]
MKNQPFDLVVKWAFAADGRGDNITLNTPAFFGENYRPAPRNG